MQQLIVRPIKIGFLFADTLRFSKPGGGALDGYDLTAATRVIGQFRYCQEDGGKPICAVDTLDGSLVVLDAQSFRFFISADTTKRISPDVQYVVVDFAAQFLGQWVSLPAMISWPVADPVTIPPTIGVWP